MTSEGKQKYISQSLDIYERKQTNHPKKANEEIKKRFEQLRTTLSRTKGKTPIVGVEKEEEKVPPHK